MQPGVQRMCIKAGAKSISTEEATVLPDPVTRDWVEVFSRLHPVSAFMKGERVHLEPSSAHAIPFPASSLLPSP